MRGIRLYSNSADSHTPSPPAITNCGSVSQEACEKAEHHFRNHAETEKKSENIGTAGGEGVCESAEFEYSLIPRMRWHRLRQFDMFERVRSYGVN
jgi:hypothetical protein